VPGWSRVRCWAGRREAMGMENQSWRSGTPANRSKTVGANPGPKRLEAMKLDERDSDE
jgi:hypothetical protein